MFDKTNASSRPVRWVFIWVAIILGFLFSLWPLHHSSYAADPLLINYLDLAGSLLAFTFAANALVRFRGSRDRLALILAFGFALTGLISMGASLTTDHAVLMRNSAPLTVPLSWMVSRTFLAVLFLVALAAERGIPQARDPRREIFLALLLVGGSAYLTSVLYFAVPGAAPVLPGRFIARPWDLLPGAIFVVATLGFWRRLKRVDTSLDRALFLAAAINVACELVITLSRHLLDAPFVAAHFLAVAGYAMVLGGALLDNARLFDQVSHLAVTDSLTGLANYRRLIETMDSEIQRAQRTRRGFSVLLLDLDGLKNVNDSYGHLLGSRALKRLARVLRLHCRAVDTAARYGGDEFALVLPEANESAAAQVAARIREKLAQDGQHPPLTVSVGAATYPRDGATIEKLLGAADRDLYAMKTESKKGRLEGRPRMNGVIEKGAREWEGETEAQRKLLM